MSKETHIEWCDATFNPWEGCEKISPACANCYAAERDKRFHGGEHWGPNSTRLFHGENYWKQPLKWNAEAEKASERRRVFCASLADVFEDRPELQPWRDDLFHLIGDTPHLDWLLLTKRPENVLRMTHDRWTKKAERHVSQNEGDGRYWAFPPNVWLGTTVENQEWADRRRENFKAIPAAVKFISYEPALGSVNWNGWEFVSQIIAGGESGSKARPAHSDWFRSTRDWCKENGKAFFFKQHGEWISGKFDRRKSKMVCDMTELGKTVGQIFWTNPGAPKVHLWDEADHYWTNASARVGKKAAGRLLDGRTWDEFPERD